MLISVFSRLLRRPAGPHTLAALGRAKRKGERRGGQGLEGEEARIGEEKGRRKGMK